MDDRQRDNKTTTMIERRPCMHGTGHSHMATMTSLCFVMLDCHTTHFIVQSAMQHRDAWYDAPSAIFNAATWVGSQLDACSIMRPPRTSSGPECKASSATPVQGKAQVVLASSIRYPFATAIWSQGVARCSSQQAVWPSHSASCSLPVTQ